MKCINKDAALLALKDRLIRAQNRKDERDIAITKAVTKIIRLLPEIDVQDGIECQRCWWYDKEHKRCFHANGLMGRVLPQMYCCYGSEVSTDTQTEVDESAFAEFDEEDE